ncbi:MAG: helix-turn-helix domain-containing protein [Gemmatimonadaceae bacterium]
MNILALLRADGRRILASALTGEQSLEEVDTAESASAAIRDGGCDALVFDPGLLDAEDFATVISAVNDSGVPMLIYTALGPVAARRIVETVDHAAREMVLRGMDDMPEVLREKLAALVAPSAPAILLSKVASRFREFPEPLQTVSVGLFARPTLPRWVGGLAKETGLARRTVDRWMNRGGLFGAGRLLDAARFARVWEPLVERGMSVDQVVAQCGYPRLRLFIAHSRRLTDVAPLELRDNYTRETFSERLAEALLE